MMKRIFFSVIVLFLAVTISYGGTLELTFSTYLGGSDNDQAHGVSLGTDGTVFITGITVSPDFPTANPLQAGRNGSSDIFVSAFSSSGSALVYSTDLGGSGSETGQGITLGTGGQVYLTGKTASTDFPTESPFQAAYGGGDWDASVTALSSFGSTLSYSTYLGGSGSDYGYGIRLGTEGKAYLVGHTLSDDFPTLNPYQAEYGGMGDAFVTALSASGTSLSYSTYLGGLYLDSGKAISLDTEGKAYLTGYTQSDDFPTNNSYQNSNIGGGIIQDAFVSALSTSGSALFYSTYLGGYGIDSGEGICLGTDGMAFVIGYTAASDFPTVNPYQGALPGAVAAFVTAFSSSGSALSYSTYLGGSNSDSGYGIAPGAEGEVYLTGYTESADFPTLDPYQESLGGSKDIFVTALASSGSALSYSTYLGGSGDEEGLAIARGSGGRVYLTGKTASHDFPTVNPYQAAFIGGVNDVFVSGLIFTTPSPIPSATPTVTPSAPPTVTPTLTPSPTPEYTPSPTPTIVIPDPTATPSPLPTVGLPWSYDYNGDGTSDIAIFRGSSGLWAIRDLSRIYFGADGDEPVPGDYDADGTTDIGIFRESSGLWAVRDVSRAYFGTAGDEPVPADYNGDGTCNVAVFRPSTGLWALREVTRIYFGTADDIPVAWYYRLTGARGISIFRPATGLWALRSFTRIYFGQSGDDPVPGDYDGDGGWEVSVFRESSGLWAIRGVTRLYFGATGDEARPADYNGAGSDAVGIFRETTGLWAVRSLTRIYFGTTGDIPVTR